MTASEPRSAEQFSAKKISKKPSGDSESRMPENPIDEAEARRILEDLARNGPATAQIASLKVLREMDRDAEARERAQREPRGFDEFQPELYAARGRSKKSAATGSAEGQFGRLRRHRA